jgi:hypothetical protein
VQPHPNGPVHHFDNAGTGTTAAGKKANFGLASAISLAIRIRSLQRENY